VLRTSFSFSINSVNFKGFLNIFTISEAVREVQNALAKDAVENKIKNWLRHCPRYKHNEYGSRNGVDEDQQEDADLAAD
jgi:hypothetical protein